MTNSSFFNSNNSSSIKDSIIFSNDNSSKSDKSNLNFISNGEYKDSTYINNYKEIDPSLSEYYDNFYN